MAKASLNDENGLRERAYFIWEREGHPADRAEHHWQQALLEEQRRSDDELIPDEEKILDGRFDVNFPALLTKDVPGG